MKILEKLELLAHYYESTRRVGHTTLVKQGTDTYDKPFLVLTYNAEGDPFTNVDRKNIISSQNPNRLRGEEKALAIDNGAMLTLLNESIEEIIKLQGENKQLKETIRLVDTILKQSIV